MHGRKATQKGVVYVLNCSARPLVRDSHYTQGGGIELRKLRHLEDGTLTRSLAEAVAQGLRRAPTHLACWTRARRREGHRR